MATLIFGEAALEFASMQWYFYPAWMDIPSTSTIILFPILAELASPFH